MKRIFICLCVFIMSSVPVFAEISYEKEQFMSSGAYDAFSVVNDYFEDFDSVKILEDFLSGNPLDEKGVFQSLLDLIFAYMIKVLKSFVLLLIIGVVIAFISNASNLSGKSNEGIGTIGGYIIFASVIITFFCELITPAKNSIADISVMVKSLFTILMTSVFVSGGAVTVGLMQNVLFVCIGVISEAVNKFLIPIIISTVMLSAAGNMSNKINVSGFIKIMRSFVKWCISLVMILFVGLFGIYGLTGASVDAVVGKTAKFLIGGSVPVVGGVVSDSIGTVLATVKAVRNITGNIGIIAIVLIAITPVVRTFVYIWSLRLCSGFLEPISDTRIIKLINDIVECSILLFVCLVSVTLLFVCAVAIVLLSANMIS